jgi:hypothetical protein
MSADKEEMQHREKERERDREKEKKTQLARAVFYGIRDREGSSSQLAPQETEPALPLFMVLCFLLALGARGPAAEDSMDKAFLYALAVQAMGVWQTYRPCHYEYDANDRGFGVEDEDATPADAQKEAEDVDFVLACLMQVMFLVRGAKSAPTATKTVFPLVCRFRYFEFSWTDQWLYIVDREVGEYGEECRTCQRP